MRLGQRKVLARKEIMEQEAALFMGRPGTSILFSNKNIGLRNKFARFYFSYV